MNRRLRSWLLTIGRAAGTRSASGGIRFFALALASLSLALTLAAVSAALAVDTVRDSRMSDGRLVLAAESTPAGETTLVKMAIDHLREGRQYTVVFLSPGGGDAPLPPGLGKWPQPGTAVVSPELLREGAEQGISRRYGDIAGTIGESGLADATELLVYVRPAQNLSAAQSPDVGLDVVAVSGFGGTVPPVPFENVHWLLANQDFLDGTLVWLLASMGVVPSLLLALVASRVAAHSRDRRDALITALGGRTSHRLWIAVGEAWGPVSLGAFVAAAVVVWFAAADRRLPIVDYVVAASDMRGQWWAFGFCVVAAAILVLCATVLGAFCPGGNRPLRRLGRRTHAARVRAFPWFVLLAAWGPYLLSDGHPAGLLAGYVGLVGIALTMSAAIGGGVAAMGRWLARCGYRRRPGLLAAGAWMAYRPTAVGRQVYGVCASIFFLLFALTMQSNFAGGAAQVDGFIDEHGYSLVEVHPRGQVTAAEVSDFVAAVPEGIQVVAYTQSTSEGDEPGSLDPRIQVTGTCPALELLALPCPAEGNSARVDTAEGALAAWLGGAGGGPVLTVASGAPSSAVVDESIALLAFTTSGDDVPAGVLHNAGVVFPFGVATSVPGESWYTGAVPHLEQSGWIVLIGGFGLVVLILAAGLGLAGEFLRFGRAIAPLTVMAGNRRIYWRSAALVSLLPLTAAVVGSFAVGYLAVRPMIPTGVNLVTPAFILTCCGAAIIAGMIMCLWSAAAAVGSADRWTGYDLAR